MLRINRRDGPAGFTLLELLIALAVLGLLLVALTQGVRVGIEFWHAQSRRAAATADLDPGARVLRRILATIPIEPAALGSPVSIGFKGRSDQLTLVGELPTGIGAARRADMTLVTRNGHLVIVWTPYRRDRPEPAPAPTVTELLGGVRHLDFAYWGSVSPQMPAAWLGKWDGPALPELIRIRIGFAPGDTRRWPDLIVAPQL